MKMEKFEKFEIKYKAGRNGTKNPFSPESKKKFFSTEKQLFLGDVTTDVMVGRIFFLKLNISSADDSAWVFGLLF